jgi:hypothetical protein
MIHGSFYESGGVKVVVRRDEGKPAEVLISDGVCDEIEITGTQALILLKLLTIVQRDIERDMVCGKK